MLRLENLIAGMCPNGVPFTDIKSVAEVGTGTSNGNEADESGMYPLAKSYLIFATQRVHLYSKCTRGQRTEIRCPPTFSKILPKQNRGRILL